MSWKGRDVAVDVVAVASKNTANGATPDARAAPALKVMLPDVAVQLVARGGGAVELQGSLHEGPPPPQLNKPKLRKTTETRTLNTIFDWTVLPSDIGESSMTRNQIHT